MTPPIKTSNLPRIGLTQGDINGIGYEVILKVLADSRIFESFTPIVYGQSKVFSYYKKNFGMEEMSYTVIRDASQAQPRRINIVNHTDEELKVEPGFSTPIAGKASFAALLMWGMARHPYFRDRKILLPVDCRTPDGKRQLGLLITRPDRFDRGDSPLDDSWRHPCGKLSLPPRPCVSELAGGCQRRASLRDVPFHVGERTYGYGTRGHLPQGGILCLSGQGAGMEIQGRLCVFDTLLHKRRFSSRAVGEEISFVPIHSHPRVGIQPQGVWKIRCGDSVFR